MKYLIVLLLVVIFVSGCSREVTLELPETPGSFQVKYYAEYSSSAGTRSLDIIYTVKDGEITDCEGNYVADMTDGKRTYECDVEKLRAREGYNVPLRNLITDLSAQEMSGEVRDGPGWYKWEITEINFLKKQII